MVKRLVQKGPFDPSIGRSEWRHTTIADRSPFQKRQDKVRPVVVSVDESGRLDEVVVHIVPRVGGRLPNPDQPTVVTI
ncbi:hypothetical protein BV898_18669 [Hypsibius exemplaris]|uniref:Uncharacterized protein n=1 Tax=Hypsibius exemplaris TaxID=2072580 RepID=A0A9X6RND1_HYPEX|nr:hypothetical protein BV898_18669 [Hypsibius exemplaris]